MKTIQIAEFVAEELQKHILSPYVITERERGSFEVAFKNNSSLKICSFVVERTSEFSGVIGDRYEGPSDIFQILERLRSLDGLFSLGAGGKN
jgi:hypothetical protein